MTKLRIIRSWDDHEPVVLGHVSTSMGEDHAQRVVEDAWEAFKATEPDSDSQFLGYLVENHGFRIIEDDFIDMVVQ